MPLYLVKVSLYCRAALLVTHMWASRLGFLLMQYSSWTWIKTWPRKWLSEIWKLFIELLLHQQRGGGKDSIHNFKVSYKKTSGSHFLLWIVALFLMKWNKQYGCDLKLNILQKKKNSKKTQHWCFWASKMCQSLFFCDQNWNPLPLIPFKKTFHNQETRSQTQVLVWWKLWFTTVWRPSTCLSLLHEKSVNS